MIVTGGPEPEHRFHDGSGHQTLNASRHERIAREQLTFNYCKLGVSHSIEVQLAWLCTKSTRMRDDYSRKGAKAQSATAFLWVFFAPLRLCARNFFFQQRSSKRLSTFRAKARSSYRYTCRCAKGASSPRKGPCPPSDSSSINESSFSLIRADTRLNVKGASYVSKRTRRTSAPTPT